MVRTFHWCLVLICVILIGSEHRAKTRLIQAPEFSVTVRKIYGQLTLLVMSERLVLVPVILQAPVVLKADIGRPP